ncbi:VWA domain-containing protein [Verrucomicrobiota bacterium]
MSEFVFQQPSWLVLLIAVAGLGILVFGAQRTIGQIRSKMGGTTKATGFSAWSGLIAALFVVLALARPASDPEPSPVYREGRDVIFVLDVSRSMLAQDMQPSRLEMAKLAVQDCMEFLPGGRIGLLLFAGSASIRCPLTEDRAFVQTVLADAGPGSVSYGSTYLQSAVEKVTDRLLSDKRRGFQDVIFLTDGGDHSDESIDASAGMLAESGARVLVVGFGNSEFGAHIPVFDGEKGGYLQHEGEAVRVKQEQDTLRELARRCGGVYLNASKGMFHLGSAYQSVSVDLERAASDGQLQLTYKERFIGFLAAALLSLFVGQGLGRFRRRMAVLLLAGLVSANGWAQEAAESDWAEELASAQTDADRVMVLVNAARSSLESDDFQTAAECYSLAADFVGAESERRALAYASAQAMGRASFGMLDEDPYVAAGMAERAELALLAQRRLAPADEGVLRDLCCVYDVQAQAVAIIEEQERADDQMQKQMGALLTKLQELVERQRAVVNESRPLRPRRHQPQPTPEQVARLCASGADQEKTLSAELEPVRHEFSTLADMMKLLVRDRLGIEGDEDNEFAKATALLDEADAALMMALQNFSEQLGLQAHTSSETAFRKMQEVLRLFANQQSSEGEEPEKSEDDEGEYEMSDEWGEGEMESMPMESAAGRMDLESRQLPEPQFSAEEILKEEAENNRAREQKSRGGDSDVKKDW